MQSELVIGPLVVSDLIVLDKFRISSRPFLFKMENARALLDELMGADRNIVKGVDYVPKVTFESEQVCRCYLVDFCPHELFTNTKSDLGICKRLHDERMRDEYRNSDKCGRLGYEQEFFDYLKKLIHDLERR
jgi:hypothetical protein